VSPDVSILILTRNGLPTLAAVLEAIAAQVVDFTFETVAVDSGSTDGTVELLKRYGARVLAIAPRQFNHGLTRNFGIEQCRGEFVVLLVQDAVPASTRWLADLVGPLRRDTALAGSYARQTPRPDASALTRYYLARWVATSEVSRTTQVSDVDAFRNLAPLDQFLTCVFDNVCSCVRRSVWQRFPFRETRIAEDLEWAKEVLLAGYALAYAADALVIHSHDRSARYELMRTYLVHQRLRALFGVATIPDLPRLLYAVATTLPIHVKCVMNGSSLRTLPREMGRGLALAVAFPLGQYLGVRSIDTGRELLRATGV
jgi:rhamnosyltransferase